MAAEDAKGAAAGPQSGRLESASPAARIRARFKDPKCRPARRRTRSRPRLSDVALKVLPIDEAKVRTRPVMIVARRPGQAEKLRREGVGQRPLRQRQQHSQALGALSRRKDGDRLEAQGAQEPVDKFDVAQFAAGGSSTGVAAKL